MTFFSHGGRQVPAAFRAPCSFCKEDQLFIKHRCVICGTAMVKQARPAPKINRFQAHMKQRERRKALARAKRRYVASQAAASRAKFEGGAQ